MASIKSIVITWDNGDRRTFDTVNEDALDKEELSEARRVIGRHIPKDASGE